MQTDKFCIFQATYRVLVLMRQDAMELHARVEAVCLEQNLVGRGATKSEALSDLAQTVLESIGHEWQELVPAAEPNPQPELVAVFEGGARETPTGEIVLQRLKMWVKTWIERVPAHNEGWVFNPADVKPPIQDPTVTFEPVYA